MQLITKDGRIKIKIIFGTHSKGRGSISSFPRWSFVFAAAAGRFCRPAKRT